MMPTEFHFLRPLWLLALLPAVLLFVTAWRSEGPGNGWRKVVDSHLLRHLLIEESGVLRRWPLYLVGLGWVASIVAMAGPTWEKVTIPGERAQRPTVIALDMSLSMDAKDMPPSRLARARFEVIDILARTGDGQTGLIVYSDEPFVATPLTDDVRIIEEMVPLLTTDLMPGVGSRADRAIDEAVDLLANANAPAGTIVLLSDGSEDVVAAQKSATAARNAGHKVSVVGFGTNEGASVEDAYGRALTLRDGSTWNARLDREGLEGIARAGGGYYTTASPDGRDLDAILGNTFDFTATTRETSGEVDVWNDMGIWLLVIPLLAAPLAFRRGWLAVFLVALALGDARTAEASAWNDLWSTPDQRGSRAFADGRPGDAAELFEDPEWRAASLYEAGDFANAATGYEALEGVSNDYNRGNALARAGKFEEAIASYDQALATEPDHPDARFNRELLQKLREEQREAKQSDADAEQENTSQGGSSAPQQNASTDQAEKGDEEEASAEDGTDSTGNGQEAATDEEQGRGDSDSGEAGESATRTEKSDQDSHAKEIARSDQTPASQTPEEGRDETKLAEQIDRALEREDTAQDPGDDSSGLARARFNEEITEEEQEREQLLRQIPQDPAGLLRAKIHRRYTERQFAAGRY